MRGVVVRCFKTDGYFIRLLSGRVFDGVAHDDRW